MKPVSTALMTTAVLLVAALLAVVLFVWFGVYDVGADTPHTKPVYFLLDKTVDRSVQTRAARLQLPPDLTASARVLRGAGNYNSMCVECHLAPGRSATELSRGLYPAPPELAAEPVEPGFAFWVIKHGIKASGMPAWGKSMADADVWDLVAFLQNLPKLDQAQYQALVAQSGGHSHGGGTAGGDEHDHDHGPEHEHEHAGENTGAHDHHDDLGADHGMAAASGARH
jgi:mono/diheme cytochrome c family protein